MARRPRHTNLNRNFFNSIESLEIWAQNPFRKASFLVLILFSSYFFGSALGAINGALDLLDPIGALFAVLFLEVLVRLRRSFPLKRRKSLIFNTLEMSRIGILTAFLIEGLKLS